ncbi:MAG TPA: FkbM family methyltransferase [Chthoniobacterales bacterium]|jgi:FkbM family methyltransferase|nr:FkbM family methyltransferase [Chthoniobacterales bacterium]
MFGAISGLLKPCYLFAPATLARRVYLHFSWPQSNRAEVELPWGMQIEVNLNDMIGREIFKQRIFDLAVSECAWRLLEPQDRVIDAGANIGYMTMLFAARVGESGLVHAFEPHPRVRTLLERNVERISRRRQSGRVVVHPSALGDAPRNAQLIETDYFALNEGTAKIAAPAQTGEGSVASHSVRVETIDALFADQSFALLKIDVEGFEAEVLRGAASLLGSQRVRHVIYEDHTLGGSGLAEVLSGHGYHVFSIGHGAFGPRLRQSGQGKVEIDASWESASFLATLVPDKVNGLMSRKGWSVLRGV